MPVIQDMAFFFFLLTLSTQGSFLPDNFLYNPVYKAI